MSVSRCSVRVGRSVLVVLAGTFALAAAAQAAVTATEFSEGFSRNARPVDIAAGPDGNLWFTDPGANAIGRITPQGQITEFSHGLSTWATTAPPGPDGPLAIAAGPDGNLWFTEPGRALIGRITPVGEITEFSRGISPGSHPTWIAAGPDGNLWFTASRRGLIGRITPDGEITEVEGTPRRLAGGITAGPDGNLWFTDGAAQIGRITPAGEVTLFSGALDAFDITAGPDGNLWFTEFGRGRIGRITPQGRLTKFRAGISSTPRSIAAGPDANLWFTEPYRDLIGQITTEGEVTELCHGIRPGAAPLELAAGPDGNLWFTEPDAQRIGRLSLDRASETLDHIPTSNVVHPRVKLRLFKRPVHLIGRACDDRQVSRVDVSLTRRAQTSKRRRCLALSRRGRWLPYRLTGRRCKPRFLLRAKPDTVWRMRLPRTLARGRYTITSRVTDSAGQREFRFSTKRGNIRPLNVGL